MTPRPPREARSSTAHTSDRQFALFRLGASLIAGAPVVVVDEPELGLEPYRQRHLILELRTLIGEHGQAFLTTHSPAALQALNAEELSRLTLGADQATESVTANPVSLRGRHIDRVRGDAPDALLARLPLLCEGATEAGLLDPILNQFAAKDGLGGIDGLGIRLVERSGQPTVLDEADELLDAGIAIGLFVDNEAQFSGRRADCTCIHRQPVRGCRRCTPTAPDPHPRENHADAAAHAGLVPTRYIGSCPSCDAPIQAGELIGQIQALAGAGQFWVCRACYELEGRYLRR